MGNRRGELGGRGSVSDNDLELLRERVLEHPDEEDAVSGNDIDNSSSTGPVKVIVKQDGIGRTGGIVLGVFAGLAFGVSVAALGGMIFRDNDLRNELEKTQTEYRVLLNHYMELQADVKEMHK